MKLTGLAKHGKLPGVGKSAMTTLLRGGTVKPFGVESNSIEFLGRLRFAHRQSNTHNREKE